MIYLASMTTSPTMLLVYKTNKLLCSSSVEWKFHLLGKPGQGLFWESGWVNPCLQSLELTVGTTSSLTFLSRSSKGPLWWQAGLSSLSPCVGQEEHVTLVIMSVNSEAAKESSKRRPRGSRQSLKHASPGNHLITRGASRHTLDGRA